MKIKIMILMVIIVGGIIIFFAGRYSVQNGTRDSSPIVIEYELKPIEVELPETDATVIFQPGDSFWSCSDGVFGIDSCILPAVITVFYLSKPCTLGAHQLSFDGSVEVKSSGSFYDLLCKKGCLGRVQRKLYYGEYDNQLKGGENDKNIQTK